MKKIVLIAAFLLASYLGHSQVYRISIDTGTFIMKDTTDTQTSGESYPKGLVSGDKRENGNIYITKKGVGTSDIPFPYSRIGGLPYTSFVNSDDEAFDDADAVVTWFRANCFNTAGGAASPTDLNSYGFSTLKTSAQNAAAFELAIAAMAEGGSMTVRQGTYNVGDIEISKAGFYEFTGATFVSENAVSESDMITILEDAGEVYIRGLKCVYTGIYYTSNPDYEDTYGQKKTAIHSKNEKTILSNCTATGFSWYGFYASNTNEGLYLDNCTANNNGYAGAGSYYGKNFTVIGGDYNENGGANGVDGYGVVGNVGEDGNYKVIGVNAQRNFTVNIDSHDAEDVIISNNLATDAGIDLPHYLTTSTEGNNISLSRVKNRVIVTGNIMSRAKGIGLGVYAATGNVLYEITSAIIANNTFEDNQTQLQIRQLKTESLIIDSNILNLSGDIALTTPYGIYINADTDASDVAYIKDLKVTNNSCNGTFHLLLSDNASSAYRTNALISNNSFADFNINFRSVETYLTANENFFGKMRIESGTNAVVKFNNNVFGTTTSTTPPFNITPFTGIGYYDKNTIIGGSDDNLVILPSNTIFTSNIIKNENATSAIESAIRVINDKTNISIIDNEVIFTNPPTYGIRVKLIASNSITIKGNKHTGNVYLDGPNINIPKTTIDPANGYYDANFTSSPSLGVISFVVGDTALNRSPTAGGYIGWICTTAGSPGTWKTYGAITP